MIFKKQATKPFQSKLFQFTKRPITWKSTLEKTLSSLKDEKEIPIEKSLNFEALSAQLL
jgi:hypothetical protein